MWEPSPIIARWTQDQASIAKAFPTHKRVAVAAANGVGKTEIAAELAASFLRDHASAALIVTAPTNRQVLQLLWPRVAIRCKLMGLPVPELNDEGFADLGPYQLFAFATNQPQRMQGYHHENLFIILDEASGMTGDMVMALEGIAVAENNFILAIGNPNEPSGAFWEMTFRPSWLSFSISALTHPNILARKEVIPGATTWASLIDRLRDWCREVPTPTSDTFQLAVSDEELHIGPSEERSLRVFLPNDDFRVRYLGRFPNAVEWGLLSRSLIEAALARPMEDSPNRVAAIDIAREGGDQTIYGLRVGNSVPTIREIQPQSLMGQAEQLAALIAADRPDRVLIDAAGIGYGVYDRLCQLVSDTPIVKFLGSDPPQNPSSVLKYANRRAEAYGNLRTACEQQAIAIAPFADTADQLAAARYRHDTQGRMIMLEKDKIKTFLGKSPDIADMLSMLWDHRCEYPAWFARSGLPSLKRCIREEEQW